MRMTTRFRLLAAMMPWLLSCGICLSATFVAAQEGQPEGSAKDAKTEQESKPDAKDESAEKDAKPPRPITFSDVADWQRVTGFSLANGGKWCGFMIMPNEGDGELVIREVEGDKKHSFKPGRSSTPSRSTTGRSASSAACSRPRSSRRSSAWRAGG